MSNTISNEEAITQSEPLEYPRDFFAPISGKNPADYEKAALLWPFRKDRPRRGCVELFAPDGVIMMAEIKAMRDRLRIYIQRKYMDDARQVARDLGLVMLCGNPPVTPKDLKIALCLLENNSENHGLVYKICHEFHKDRSWMSNAVDNWFLEENMVLLADTNENSRSYACCRGGFGNVARQAKAQSVQTLMLSMRAQAKWCIATTNNIRSSTKLIYEPLFQLCENNTSQKIYLVTSNPDTIVSNDNDNFAGNNSEFNYDDDENRQLVDVCSLDFTNMASMMTQQLGVPVSEDTLKSVFCHNVSLRPNLSGRTMIMIPNEESLTTMTSVGNNCTRSVNDPIVNNFNYDGDTPTLHEDNEDNLNTGNIGDDFYTGQSETHNTYSVQQTLVHPASAKTHPSREPPIYLEEPVVENTVETFIVQQSESTIADPPSVATVVPNIPVENVFHQDNPIDHPPLFELNTVAPTPKPPTDDSRLDREIASVPKVSERTGCLVNFILRYPFLLNCFYRYHFR